MKYNMLKFHAPWLENLIRILWVFQVGEGWQWVGSGLGIHIDWCINNDKGYQFATEKFPYVAVFLLVS